MSFGNSGPSFELNQQEVERNLGETTKLVDSTMVDTIPLPEEMQAAVISEQYELFEGYVKGLEKYIEDKQILISNLQNDLLSENPVVAANAREAVDHFENEVNKRVSLLENMYETKWYKKYTDSKTG